MKPYSESCDQNREPILKVIQPLLKPRHSVLEIGSGSGQHAVFFARQMPHLIWHTSDRVENHPGIRLWIDEANLSNLRSPLPLDVARDPWPEIEVDAVFSANTAHIMGWPDVQAMFRGVGRVLPTGGLFLLYGPFNYGGAYTSDSNARFDQWLKGRDSDSGIRDFEALDQQAREAGMRLHEDYEMPANNRILCWCRAS